MKPFEKPLEAYVLRLMTVIVATMPSVSPCGLLEIYQCWTLHLDMYSVYYTLLGAFYNFRMKYPLNWATFVDFRWPLRVATLRYFYGLDRQNNPQSRLHVPVLLNSPRL